VDVARFGNDLTVFCWRKGDVVLGLDSLRGQDTMETAGRVARAVNEGRVRPENVHIDDSGVGGGVTDRLREQGMDVHACVAAAKAIDAERYENQRAEMFFTLRDLLNPAIEDGALKLAQFEDRDELVNELAVIQYGTSSRGRLKIEDKAEIKKKRDGRSPDRADALALTYAPKEAEVEKRGGVW
jgi:hypothetical protein